MTQTFQRIDMFRNIASFGLLAAVLLTPVQAFSQGAFAGEPVPTAGQDEFDSTLPINTHTGGYEGGFGGGAWHPNAWHTGDIGGTWHGDGWHADGATAGGFNGPSTVNNYYNQGCSYCSGAPQPNALQSAFDESLPAPSDTGSLYARPPAGCSALDSGDQQCGDARLHPYYGNNGVYYRNEGAAQ
jgi:hypothetical protein